MSNLPKLAIIGYGKMGKEIEETALNMGFEINEKFDIDTPITANQNYTFDIAIDFSSPAAVIQNAEIVAKLKKNLIIGTTAWYDRIDELQEIVRKNNITCVYASNYSIGMNIFFKIIDSTSQLINNFNDFDIMVSEAHHKNKLDHPSGTALSIANIILSNIERKNNIVSNLAPNSAINNNDLNVSYSRLGSIMGNHSVIIDSEADTITLTHKAKSRKGFASGALYAAKWINNNKERKGLFNFSDII